jgi:hypothetical protein
VVEVTAEVQVAAPVTEALVEAQVEVLVAQAPVPAAPAEEAASLLEELIHRTEAVAGAAVVADQEYQAGCFLQVLLPHRLSHSHWMRKETKSADAAEDRILSTRP